MLRFTRAHYLIVLPSYIFKRWTGWTARAAGHTAGSSGTGSGTKSGTGIYQSRPQTSPLITSPPPIVTSEYLYRCGSLCQFIDIFVRLRFPHFDLKKHLKVITVEYKQWRSRYLRFCRRCVLLAASNNNYFNSQIWEPIPRTLLWFGISALRLVPGEVHD